VYVRGRVLSDLFVIRARVAGELMEPTRLGSRDCMGCAPEPRAARCRCTHRRSLVHQDRGTHRMVDNSLEASRACHISRGLFRDSCSTQPFQSLPIVVCPPLDDGRRSQKRLRSMPHRFLVYGLTKVAADHRSCGVELIPHLSSWPLLGRDDEGAESRRSVRRDRGNRRPFRLPTLSHNHSARLTRGCVVGRPQLGNHLTFFVDRRSPHRIVLYRAVSQSAARDRVGDMLRRGLPTPLGQSLPLTAPARRKKHAGAQDKHSPVRHGLTPCLRLVVFDGPGSLPDQRLRRPDHAVFHGFRQGAGQAVADHRAIGLVAPSANMRWLGCSTARRWHRR